MKIYCRLNNVRGLQAGTYKLNNGENFYILKGDLEVYLKDSDDWLPTMLNEKFGLTKLDLSEFEFDKDIQHTKAEYAHVGKLRKYLNNKYQK